MSSLLVFCDGVVRGLCKVEQKLCPELTLSSTTFETRYDEQIGQKSFHGLFRGGVSEVVPLVLYAIRGSLLSSKTKRLAFSKFGLARDKANKREKNMSRRRQTSACCCSAAQEVIDLCTEDEASRRRRQGPEKTKRPRLDYCKPRMFLCRNHPIF